jgi:vacuolar-type H+-ATPase subunit F/Vma7
MSTVAAIGDRLLLDGYALVGVEVVDAPDPAAAQRAWDELPADVGLVLLSAAAHDALDGRLEEKRVLWVVVPG